LRDVLGDVIGCEQDVFGFAEDLAVAITKYLLRAGIPGVDQPFGVGRVNCIVRKAFRKDAHSLAAEFECVFAASEVRKIADERIESANFSIRPEIRHVGDMDVSLPDALVRDPRIDRKALTGKSTFDQRLELLV